MSTPDALRATLLALAWLLAPGSGAAVAVAYVDLADAYERSTALKALITEVDQQLTLIRRDFEAQGAPLLAEIEALAESRMHEDARLGRKRELLLKLAEFEQSLAKRQQAIARANQKATAQVDAQIARIEDALTQAYQLQALFRTQDLLFYKPGSTLDLSAELYQRLNAALPAVVLELPPAQ